MPELTNFVKELALLLSCVSGVFTTYIALKKMTHENSKDDNAQIRGDRDYYHELLRKTEKEYGEELEENKHLREEITDLKIQITKLKRKIAELKKEIKQ